MHSIVLSKKEELERSDCWIMLALLVANKSSWLLNTMRSFPGASEVWRRIVAVIAQHTHNTAPKRLWASWDFIIIICNSRTWSWRLYELSLEITGLYHMCLPSSYSSLFTFLCIVLCTECPSIGIWIPSFKEINWCIYIYCWMYSNFMATFFPTSSYHPSISLIHHVRSLLMSCDSLIQKWKRQTSPA